MPAALKSQAAIAMPYPPIESSITFLYTHELATSVQFYEDVLGLELWQDLRAPAG